MRRRPTLWRGGPRGRKAKDRPAIVRHMLGDLKRYSLTPTGRKDRDDGGVEEPEDAADGGAAPSGAACAAA